jgi:hypothetical protein
MKVSVSVSITGVFAYDENGKLAHYILFRPDPAMIAERLSQARRGDIIPEEESLLRELITCGYRQVAWDKKVDFPGIAYS